MTKRSEFRRTKLIGCHVSPDEKRSIREVARSQGLGTADFIRIAIAFYLARLQIERGVLHVNVGRNSGKT